MAKTIYQICEMEHIWHTPNIIHIVQQIESYEAYMSNLLNISDANDF
jgi:hypothetical protein